MVPKSSLNGSRSLSLEQEVKGQKLDPWLQKLGSDNI